MAVPQRWIVDPRVVWCRVGGSVLAYHGGSGDTHLLTASAGELLARIDADADRFAPVVDAASAAEAAAMTETLDALAEAELVHRVVPS